MSAEPSSTLPPDPLLNASCFDLLLIELVPLAERLSQRYEESIDDIPSLQAPPTASTQPPGSTIGKPQSEIHREGVYFRLDSLGFRVGLGLSERFSRDRPRFTDQLDVIKFLCKDLWTVAFRKQIDNLKTNHRGVYVLTDNKFRSFQRMSMVSGAEAVVRAQPHLWFPCGVIRGALANLGIKAEVKAEVQELPVATFQITTTGAKG